MSLMYQIMVMFLIAAVAGLTVLAVRLTYLRHKYRGRLFARILKRDGEMAQKDITSKSNTFEHESADYEIQPHKTVIEKGVINKRCIYYLEGYPQPIWFPESSLKQKAREEAEGDEKEAVRTSILVDAFELHNLLRPALAKDLLSTESLSLNLSKKQIFLIVGAIIIILIVYMLMTGGGSGTVVRG